MKSKGSVWLDGGEGGGGMIISEHDRKRCARLLRAAASLSDLSWPSLMLCLGVSTRRDAVLLLAEMVEAGVRTCHDVSFDPLREFVCSWCGCHLDVFDIESNPTIWLGGSPIDPKFCPNCGAKVLQE